MPKPLSNVNELAAAIKEWAQAHDLWYDAKLWSPADYLKSAHRDDLVLILTFDGPLYDVFWPYDAWANGQFSPDDAALLVREFEGLLAQFGCWHDYWSKTRVDIMKKE